MAIAPLQLTDLQQNRSIVDEQGRPTLDFVGVINRNNKNSKQTVLAILENIEMTATAQAAADQAQDDAIQGIADAAAAQATASGAVPKDAGPTWAAPTGTAARTSFATYTAPTISNPPTQAEVQAIADALQVHSRALKAIVDDLTANGALTL